MAVLAALCLALAACGGGDERPPEPGDRVVARIGEDAVWASDVRREAIQQGLIGAGEPFDLTSEMFHRVLDGLIDQKLLAAEAGRRGLADSPLAAQRLAAARDQILGDMLVETVVNSSISEQRIEALYREQVRTAESSDEVRSRVILSRTREEAEAVLGALAQGASFEAVAAQSSIDDATRYSGGDLGYRTLDVLPEAYAEALGDKPAGSTIGPFQTENGWAVLRIEDRRRETPPTFEQARPHLVRYLTYDGVRQLIEDLRGRARIEVLLPAAPDGVGEPASAPRTPASPADGAAS